MFKRMMSLLVQKLLFDRIYHYQKKFDSKNILPEHLLLAIIEDSEIDIYSFLVIDEKNLKKLITRLKNFLTDYKNYDSEIVFSGRLNFILENAMEIVEKEERDNLDVKDLIFSLSNEDSSLFKDFIEKNNIGHIKFDFNKKKSEFQDLDDDKKNSAFLEKFTKNFTQIAKDGGFDPIIGREEELDRLIQILSRRKKNNPILTGEPGVGKTALVEGLALKIISNNIPENLKDVKLINLDLGSLIAGTKYRGEFEERLKKIVSIVMSDKKIILFIDEIHTLVGAGNPEGGMDAANILKPALSRGEFQCIGATTLSEYRKKIEKDPALERRFQMLQIEEPTEQESIEILRGIKENFEKFHNVLFSDDAIVEAVKLSTRFITDRFQPDKAIDLMDEAGAAIKVINNEKPKNIVELEKKVEEHTSLKLNYVKNQDYEAAAKERDIVIEITAKLERAKNRWIKSRDENTKIVDSTVIRKVISGLTGVALEKISQSESVKLLNLEKKLSQSVVGQKEAISILSNSIRKSRLGLNSPNRPIGSFLFLGPTGVGKTHLAKNLAKFLFGSQDFLVRVDMSDYMEKHNVSKLIGAPPGYIGFENGGSLTEIIRRKSYSVILFDEIEKAHADVFNILLQALEEGEIVDNLGHKVSFRNCIIIMTSNLGSKEFAKDNRLGFDSKTNLYNYEDFKNSALAEMKKFLSPEFINRLDDIVVFKSLDKKDIALIFDLMFDETKERFKNIGINLEISREVKNYLIDKEFDEKYGARVLRRAISKYIEDELTLKILNKDKLAHIFIKLNSDNSICFDDKKDSLENSMEKV